MPDLLEQQCQEAGQPGDRFGENEMEKITLFCSNIILFEHHTFKDQFLYIEKK